MTSPSRSIVRATLTATIASLTLLTTGAAQLAPLDDSRQLNGRVVVARGLQLPEHQEVRAGGAVWHPQGIRLLFAGVLQEPDFVASPNTISTHDTLGAMYGLGWSTNDDNLLITTGSTLSRRATARMNDTLRVVSAQRPTGSASVTISTGTSGVSGSFSPRGTRIAITATNGITVYDAANGRELQGFRSRSEGSPDDNGQVRTSTPRFFDWSTDDSRLLVGTAQTDSRTGNRFTISMLNGATLALIRGIDAPATTTIARFNPSNSGQMLLAGEDLTIVNTATGATIRTIPFAQRLRSAQWRADGRQIVTLTAETNAWQVWDVATGSQVLSGTGREVLFSVSGDKLAVLNSRTGGGTVITVHSVATGEVKQTLELQNESVGKLQWHPNGIGILAVGARRIHIWRVN